MSTRRMQTELPAQVRQLPLKYNEPVIEDLSLGLILGARTALAWIGNRESTAITAPLFDLHAQTSSTRGTTCLAAGCKMAARWVAAEYPKKQPASCTTTRKNP